VPGKGLQDPSKHCLPAEQATRCHGRRRFPGKFFEFPLKFGATFLHHRIAVNFVLQEAKSGVISLEEEDPQIFERVVKFMYTSDYSNSLDSATTATAVTASTNSGTVPRDLIVHTRVYISAEKWDIPALKNLAAKKFEDALLLEGETSSFAESLRLMFEETPENDRLLKDVALKFAGNNYKELISMGEFKAMCKKNGEVAIEVLTAVATAAAASSLSLSFYCPCLMCVQNARKLATLQSTPETTSRSVELSAAKTAVPSSMGT
jgi:hypothetical protein